MAEEQGSYYDQDARIVYLRLGCGRASATTEETDWGLIDYDSKGQVVGLELRRAGELLPKSLIEVLPALKSGDD
jgi:uncharacterized protein YuzE